MPLEQDAGHISRGADSNLSLTTLLHPISFLTEPEGLLSADGLSCVFMPFRHGISHNCSVVHNDSLGEVLRIHLQAVLGSALPLKFLSSLHRNMLYSVTFVYYTVSFLVCLFCHGHVTTLSTWIDIVFVAKLSGLTTTGCIHTVFCR